MGYESEEYFRRLNREREDREREWVFRTIIEGVFAFRNFHNANKQNQQYQQNQQNQQYQQNQQNQQYWQGQQYQQNQQNQQYWQGQQYQQNQQNQQYWQGQNNQQFARRSYSTTNKDKYDDSKFEPITIQKVCSRCNRKIRPDVLKCPYCNKLQEQEVIVCPKCYNVLWTNHGRKKFKNCPRCKTKL